MADPEFNILADIAEDLLRSVEVAVLNSITPPTDEGEDFIRDLIERLRQQIITAVETGDRTLAAQIQQIVNPLELRLIEADQQVRILSDKIEAWNAEIMRQSGATVDLLSTKIDQSIEAQITVFSDSLSAVEKIVIDTLEAQSIEAQKQFTIFGLKIGDAFDATMEFIDRTTGPIMQSVTDIIPGFGMLMEAMIIPFLTPIASVFDKPEGFFKTVLETVFTNPLKGELDKSALQIDELIVSLEDDEAIGPLIKQFTGGGVIGFGMIGVLFLGMVAQAVASSAISSFMAGPMMKVTQKSMRGARPGLLSVGEWQESLRRESDHLIEATDDMRDQGFSEDRIKWLADLASTLLPAAEIIQLWLREEIDENAVDTRLGTLGYKTPEIENLKTLGFAIPGIGDIIRMAVREVFTPEIAERFGQFEDIPDAFIMWAKRQGLDEFWAKNFWAAHWELPSIGQAFEMFHRTIDVSPDSDADIITLPSGKTTQNVIGSKSIQTLLRAQDVMPWWRDKLTQIAFRPLTRVDVRRMHAMGVLDDDAVFRAYLDQGYDQDNARKMLDFTIAFNKTPTDVDVDDARSLTRTQILLFLEDGLMSESEALENLSDIGYSLDHSVTIVESKLLDMSRDLRKLQVATIRERFVNGMLDFNDVTELLAPLGLTPVQVEKILVDMEGIRKSKVRIPTRADLDKFIGAGIVEDAEYLLIMGAIGYVDPWPDRFLQLAKG